MAKTSAEFEKEFIDTAREKTGRTLQDWVAFLKTTGIDKRNPMMEMLKTTQGLNHMQAQLLTGIFLNNGQPVYMNEGSLLDQQFEKANALRPLFDELTAFIGKAFPDMQLIPKKTYLSFTATREFAAVNVKAGELRLGLDLGDHPFEERVQKAKLSGPMPRISHMVVLKESGEIDNALRSLLQQSYQRCHQK